MGRIAAYALSAIIILLLFLTVFGQHGVLHYTAMSREVTELDQKNRKLKSDIVRLENHLYGLRTNDGVLEKLAREELGLSKPGEIVYIFPESPAQDLPTGE